MHPIERLRYVARSQGDPADSVARDAAASLAGFADDPTSLVTACRRLTERHATSGPVWWVCARTLLAADPGDEAWRCLDELVADRTIDELRFALPEAARVAVVGWPDRLSDALASRGDVEVCVIDVEGDGSGFARFLDGRGVPAVDVHVTAMAGAVSSADVVVLDASMIGPQELLAVPGSHTVAALALSAGVPVWAVGGEGRALPPRLWARARSLLEPRDPDGFDLGVDVVPLRLVDCVVTPVGTTEPDDPRARPTIPDVPELA